MADLPALRAAISVVLPRGGRPSKSSVSEDDVQVMLAMYAAGQTQREIGLKYGLSQPHISLILTRGLLCWREQGRLRRAIRRK